MYGSQMTDGQLARLDQLVVELLRNQDTDMAERKRITDAVDRCVAALEEVESDRDSRLTREAQTRQQVRKADRKFNKGRIGKVEGW